MMIFEHFQRDLRRACTLLALLTMAHICFVIGQTPAGVQRGKENKGVKLSSAESTTVANTLTKLKNLTDSITITKTGQKFATGDIDKDLKKALAAGRIGKE